MTLVEQLVTDLRQESADLDEIVAPLSAAQWRLTTPAEPWTIADTIGHLTWTDRVSVVAATEPDRFESLLAEEVGSLGEVGDAVTALALQAGEAPHDELLAAWREARAELATALLTVPAGVRLPWFGPPMSAPSMATARLMETWAHGRDVADTLGVTRTPTSRLRHVAHLAIRARGFAFAAHDRPVPDEDVRVELAAPDGSVWEWGDADAADRVTGSALDFCLLAVQRIHRQDTDVSATGPVADEWLDVVQAFAGPPGDRRAPRTGS